MSQGYTLASQLGHSVVDPVPSLFTFKIEDLRLRELSGVKNLSVKLLLYSFKKNFKFWFFFITIVFFPFLGHATFLVLICSITV